MQRRNKLDNEGKVIFSEWYSPHGTLIWSSAEWEYAQAVSSTGLTTYLNDEGKVRAIIQSKDGLANGSGIFFSQPAAPGIIREYINGEIVNEVVMSEP